MKRIFWIALIQIVLLLGFTLDVNARERRSFYSGIRCQAMGGACIAVVNDETALLVNPAGLGKLRDIYGTIFDPEIESNTNANDMYADSAYSNPFNLSDVKPALDANRGSYYHAKAQLFPSIVGRNFGIGIYGNSLLDAQMSADGTTIDTYYRSDLAAVLGFNFRFFDGRIKLGVNTKLIDRVEVDNTALSSSGSLEYKDIANSGLGLSTDVGLILSAPWTFLPTVSAVLRDIGGTSFNQGSGFRMSTTGRPNVVSQDLDVAAALFPIHSNYVRSTWTVEYRGLLTTADEPDKAKLLHAGIELNLGDVFFVRAGYNQRYWTAGLELASERFQWQLASYGEEIGTVDTPKEDRRYSLKFAYRF
ncbi:PorV/PorQ family protein [Bdellovibrio svalbardensis]|uniref:Long-chain fatty acid transport protein n=1 Tax=Bdellovibrio svalbardensis TaxID=2972972 RepID=A0ABT6DFH7_9BACT|nr:hypothetical protein [Bdellovibrio svalbardensis]MDG0815586.1 hypothetical protein [Bdellovibrio svalbardensis]